MIQLLIEYSVHLSVVFILQERRIGRESSRSHHDLQQENHANRKLDNNKQLGEEACDSSECGQSGRSQYPQTKWR